MNALWRAVTVQNITKVLILKTLKFARTLTRSKSYRFSSRLGLCGSHVLWSCIFSFIFGLELLLILSCSHNIFWGL